MFKPHNPNNAIKTKAVKLKLIKGAKHIHELEFLPAVLAVQKTPPHPLPRIILWVLSSLFLIALLWALIGQMDIVATATGKIIPSGHVKEIQPLAVAAIKKVFVKDGDTVKKDQVLIELDTTESQADLLKIQAAYAQALLDSTRFQVLLDYLANTTNSPPTVFQVMARRETSESTGVYKEVNEDGERASQRSQHLKDAGWWPNSKEITPQMLNDSQNQFQHQWQAMQGQLNSLKANVNQAQTQINTANAVLQKYQKLLPILTEKHNAYQALVQKGYVSQQEYAEVNKELITLQQDIQVQQSELIHLQAQRQVAEQQLQATHADLQKTTGEQLLEANATLRNALQELIKAQSHHNLTQLTSPIDGTIEQLDVHTEGGVVTPAQSLMIVVPQDNQVLIQAELENQEVGFVKTGQPVVIKIAAFPFTRYGTLNGTVTSVSRDAKEDPQTKQLRYTVYITLAKNSININGQAISLTPGMSVVAEINTGKRRIIDFFLSPLIQEISTALHER